MGNLLILNLFTGSFMFDIGHTVRYTLERHWLNAVQFGASYSLLGSLVV